jgi:hypothetical protein
VGKSREVARMSDRTFVIGMLSTLRPRMVLAYKAAEALVKAGRDVEVIVRQRKSKRSIEQNKRYWALLREVSAAVWVDGRQFSDEVWHEQFRRWFIGIDEIVMPDGEIVMRGISTTTLSVAEFGDYMARIEQWCVEQGYPVMEAA